MAKGKVHKRDPLTLRTLCGREYLFLDITNYDVETTCGSCKRIIIQALKARIRESQRRTAGMQRVLKDFING